MLCCNTTGTEALSTAGSGDVLAGLCASVLLRTKDAYAAACIAAYYHGLAGREAARMHGENGVLAGDLTDAFSAVLWDGAAGDMV